MGQVDQRQHQGNWTGGASRLQEFKLIITKLISDDDDDDVDGKDNEDDDDDVMGVTESQS